MMAQRPGGEPDRLKRGKAFHAKVQADWKSTAEGLVNTEKTIAKPSGRVGRIDIHVDADEQLVAVVEIKASDWDAMTDKAVRRNVKRHARQVWQYIQSQLAAAKEVSPGIIFSQRPSDPKRLATIEALFDAEDIPVAWEDESISERRNRADAED